MDSAKIFVAVAHGTGSDSHRLAVFNGTDAFGRACESLDEVEARLSCARVLREGWMELLHQNASKGDSWEAPQTINITSDQISLMGLERVRLTPAA